MGSPGAPRGSRAAVARAAERSPPNSLRHTGDAGVFRCLDTLWDGLYEADPTGGVADNIYYLPLPRNVPITRLQLRSRCFSPEGRPCRAILPFCP